MWPKPQPTWPEVEHSGVSFVPVAGIPGHALGIWQASEPDPYWCPQGSGVYEMFANFFLKSGLVWIPPKNWETTHIPPGQERPSIRADLTNAGPMELLGFLTGIRFKRDYIGKELEELQDRNLLEAPKYEIRMLIEE